MLNKNTNDEMNSNMLNLDDPESEMGGDKKKIDKKATMFIVFVLFLLLGLIFLFITPSSKKDTVKEEAKRDQKLVLPSVETPKLNFSEQPPPPPLADGNLTNSLDLVKKRQLDLSIIEGSSLKKEDYLKNGQPNGAVIKKTYGLNALDSSSSLDEESSSQYIIKRRSSNNSSNSTLMVVEDVENNKSTVRPSNTPAIRSDLDFSDFLKNDKSYMERLDNISNTKQDSDSAKKFPESVLGESVNAGGNAVAKPEPYHVTVLARKIPMNPNFFIPQGTSIRCVMETIVIADVSGPTLCIVPESIRSFNGLNVLIPKGSRIIGDYEKTSLREERVAIIWTRLITPDNIDIALNSMGTSLLGSNNVPGTVDKRWGERLFTAILISLGIDAFSWKVVDKLPKKSKTTTVNGNTVKEEVDFDSVALKNARSFTEEELKKSLDIPYRLVINQGTIGSIFVARDLDFSSVYADSK